MFFDEPIPFAELVARGEQLQIMPTNLSSAELSQLDAAIREGSFFSAKVQRRDVLESFKTAVDKILHPETRMGADGKPHSTGLNLAQARTALRQDVVDSGYQPEPGKEGTLQDLSSDPRIDLVVRQNVQTAQGYGEMVQGNTDEALELYPCWELFRLESRERPREWEQIWRNAAEQVGDEGAVNALKQGKMVARKDSEIWTAISEFDRPYPPFRFNSGMWVRDVDRDTAVALGVIDMLDVIEPRQERFNPNKEAA